MAYQRTVENRRTLLSYCCPAGYVDAQDADLKCQNRC